MTNREDMMKRVLEQGSDYQVSAQLKNRIMTSVRNEAQSPASFTPKKQPARRITARTLSATAAMLILAASGTYAAVTHFEIKSEKGDALVTYQAAPPIPEEKLEQMKQEQAKVDRLRSTLEPGTAAAIYQSQGADGKPAFFFIENPLILTDRVTLAEKTGELLPYPEELAPGYKFENATLFYQYETDDSQKAAMEAEAKEHKKEYVIKEVPTLPDILTVSLAYKNTAGDSLYLNMRPKEGKSRVVVPAKHEQAGMVTVHGGKGLYTEYIDPEGKKRKKLEWMQAGTDWHIAISAPAELSQEDLIKLAQKLSTP